MQQILDNQYDQGGKPLENMSLTDLIHRSEIELSKNSTFKLMELSAMFMIMIVSILMDLNLTKI